MLGEKLRGIREAKGLVQGRIAAEPRVDAAFMSKMENKEKPAHRGSLVTLVALLGIPDRESLTVWQADKCWSLGTRKEVGTEAMATAQPGVEPTWKEKM